MEHLPTTVPGALPTSILFPIDHARTAVRRIPPSSEQQDLLHLLTVIEENIEALRALLFSRAESIPTEQVQSLIRAIRHDRRSIESLCIHRCDRNDPERSIQHDLLNNDETAGLYEHLAAAADLGVARDRIIILHQLQRDICKRLKELGIDVSQN